jgi:ubiquinone/menaquinone biosynthesis C-methylase UbiE
VHQIPYDDDTFGVVISTNMVHPVDNPVQMLNEIERILAPVGCLFIADVRRPWIGLLDRTFKSALTLDEAQELIDRSNVREESFSSSLLRW